MDVDLSRRRSAEGRVLVVGAGPVGLVCALLLRRFGADVEIIDRNTGPVSESRATDLHPASLEKLDAYGVTRELLDIGQVVRSATVHCGGRVAGTIRMGRSGSPFPFALTVPQCTTEGLLQEILGSHGTKVERGVELTEIVSHDDGVEVATASVTGPACRRDAYDWVIASDGATSTVRQSLGIGFLGETTTAVSAIADVELDLPFARDEIHLFLARGGGVHVLPMPVEGYVRLMVDRWPGQPGEPAAPDVFVDLVAERLGLDQLIPRGVRWTSSFVMHRRVADRLRLGRVLLAGDAAHLCTPIGGQGLNCGIADAVAWVPALISVMQGHAPEATLDHVAERRRRSAMRTVRAAWWASRVNSPNHAAVSAARDLIAPAGVRLTRGLISRWLSGRFDS